MSSLTQTFVESCVDF